MGGDRNMEQGNLIVTADGKTWDETTRDTSYIGNLILSAKPSEDKDTSGSIMIFTEYRGVLNKHSLTQKDIAIAYDRFIFLKDGNYHIQLLAMTTGGGVAGYISIFVDGVEVSNQETNPEASYRGNLNQGVTLYLRRGQYVYAGSAYNVEGTDDHRTGIIITRV